MNNVGSRAGGMGELAEVTGPFEVAPFGKTLAELGASMPQIVGITADMGRYSDIHPFRDAFPDRFFNAGMAEQDTIMIAAGLAKVGKVAFAATYSAFLTRRALDFMAISCAHSRADVKVMAGSPGLVNPYGGTHQALEDLAVMRAIPNMTVIDPCDATELKQVVHVAAETPGTFYIRNLRGKVPVVLDEHYEFQLGKAAMLREGTDVGIVSTGFMTARALDAADRAARVGVSVGVLHVPTIKPFDVESVLTFASTVKRLVTAENHLRTGGLGTLVLESLFDAGEAKPTIRIGLGDRFHPCGSQDYLDRLYGLDTNAITDAAVTGRWNY
ncbi:transketolase family protein [Microbacterium sp. LRZ72]|uniref:transketolase family protein n=1 Tax=Microbacterium sp. LRZ72 TaxID=2942481 RepID=UPI0029A013D6|nr:transketolase C-terminal domain-containing protein [Microbacterium sp. LRZ72]MDX2376111.1 transketolase family protein [Microbacterium sp. LRZ72]